MMAVDPTQSKIPRLGGDGIATSGGSTRIPRGLKSPSLKAAKPNNLAQRLRNPQLSLSSDQIFKKLTRKSSPASSNEKCRMQIDDDIVTAMSDGEDHQHHWVHDDDDGGDFDGDNGINNHSKEKSLVDVEVTEKKTADIIILSDPNEPELFLENEEMDIDDHLEDNNTTTCPKSPTIGANCETIKNQINPNKPRFSFGLDLTDCSLDCSIDLCDTSGSSAAPQVAPAKSPNLNLTKQNSFEVDESLGILTPDQMKEFLDSATTTTNLDLPLEGHGHSGASNHKAIGHRCRIDQTPSPEELPLDPVSVKTDISDALISMDSLPPASVLYQELSQTDSDSKMDAMSMTKSTVSKVSNSFITSITSVTSLDTGYQGDGEMSRPASRGADHSPSNLSRVLSITQQKIQNNNNTINWNMNAHPPIPRRQDPMTDSDFFTESDADDVVNRGDRRAQVIDGQLYGPSLQAAANVFIEQENEQGEESCMESSGIFTDAENRGDNDMSPDTSTETIRSNSSAYSQRKVTPTNHNFPSSQTYSNITSPITSQANQQGGVSQSPSSDNNLSLISDVSSYGSSKSSNMNESKSTGAATTITSPSTRADKKKNSLASSLSSTQITKKLSPSRKQNKNEANAYLKKHEMSKRSSIKSTGASPSSAVSRKNSGGDDRAAVDNSTRPTSINIGPTVTSARKSASGNKWDAVMHKIERNKSSKLNFSDVKSKVSCGVVSASSVKRPPSSLGGLIKSASTTVNHIGVAANRNMLCNSKRGRTFSKDSQQSSQSDISLSGGASPKLHTKSPLILRSAKKRDVRTISNSPSDLGPPSKTIGAPRSPRGITLQKRIAPVTTHQSNPASTQTTAAPSPTGPAPPSQDTKSSPPAKKVVATRRSITAAPKLPLKDHNRLVGLATSSAVTTANSAATAAAAPTTVTSQSPAKNVITNNNTSSTKSSQRSSPSHGGGTNGVHQRNGIIDKSGGRNASNNNAAEVANRAAATANAALSVAELNLSHANKGIEALGVLVQHLVFNLEAFSCPKIKSKNAVTCMELSETRLLLDDTRAQCNDLEEQIIHKETLFAAREVELNQRHHNEILKAEAHLSELEQASQDRIANLHNELSKKDAEVEERIQDHRAETARQLTDKNTVLKAAEDRETELIQRITALSCTENELREKVLASETEFGERLRCAAMRERELADKVNLLNRQLDEMKTRAEQKERELGEKLHISQDEIGVLRRSTHSNRNSPDINHCQSKSPTLLNGVSALQDEVESLRCVLELKQSEISDLRKQNLEYQRAAEELPTALFKVSAMESRVEDLQSQLSSKMENEKELIQRNKHLQEVYAQEVNKCNRLSRHKEELQYRLKQNSEKYNHVLNEFSRSYSHDTSSGLLHSSSKSLISDLENSMCANKSQLDFFEMDDVSPPSSPIIKGVVEKSDSVSYVLEIDDEAPEKVASRVVRRVGSFRLSSSEKNNHSPIPKRQRCQLNPLSQSASATAILRPTNDAASPLKATASPRLSQRTRSKSVCVKDSSAVAPTTPENTKQIVRSKSNNSTTSARTTMDPWGGDQPMCTSSPFEKNHRHISEETLEPTSDNSLTLTSSPDHHNHHRGLYHDDVNYDDDYATSYRPKRITCDTAALITERDELCPSLPSHPSMQDMKKIQNLHPKESAGEAMVSGSNSEDDASSLCGGGSTPMEVSWSEDGDHYPSESIV